jgi:hypothetical protein
MYLESLGRWIDNLLGDERLHRAAQENLAPHHLQGKEVPEDPPPLEPLLRSLMEQ